MIKDSTLAFDRQENLLVIIDQTLLPAQTKLLYLKEPGEIYEAIYSLRVRGAPAIGVAAAVGFAVCAKNINTDSKAEYLNKLREIANYFMSSRPTAQNLFWAIERMLSLLENVKDQLIEHINLALADEAEKILNEDIEVCKKIGKNGFDLIKNKSNILTHCNAGRLAAVKYGTALAPIYYAKDWGKSLNIYACETRPLLQGSRLTAFELVNAGIKTSVICDNMAASLMAKGKIDAVITGADRIAKNYDTANKIGTFQLAILAKHFDIPFYIAAPKSTFDPECKTGDDIIIENRPGEELAEVWTRAEGERPDFSYNPAFDVTPSSLIDAIITEEEVVYLKEDKNEKKLK